MGSGSLVVKGIRRRIIFIFVEITGDGYIEWQEIDIMPIFSGVVDRVRS